MPNVASVLKGEISRVARKEVRGETLALKKAGLESCGWCSRFKRWQHGRQAGTVPTRCSLQARDSMHARAANSAPRHRLEGV